VSRESSRVGARIVIILGMLLQKLGEYEIYGADMGYLAACARHRFGDLISGARGVDVKERASDYFAAQGFRNAERCLAMSAPGFSGPR